MDENGARALMVIWSTKWTTKDEGRDRETMKDMAAILGFDDEGDGNGEDDRVGFERDCRITVCRHSHLDGDSVDDRGSGRRRPASLRESSSHRLDE